jgi:hypothetical protein
MLRSKLFPCRRLGSRLLIDIRDIEKTMDESTQFLNLEQSNSRGEII